MPTIQALVDYYNVTELHARAAASYKDHRDAIELLVERLVEATRDFDPVPNELRLRLYGGWHDEDSDGPTEAREILGAIAARHFPYRSALRVHLNLADALLAFPDENLDHTLRKSPGFSPFRLARREDSCSLPPEECCIEVLRSWRQGRCLKKERCSIRTADIVTSMRQKMVDTAIVADLFALAQSSLDAIAAVTNDDDIVPGLLGASHYSKRIALIQIDKSKVTAGDRLCERLGIRVVNAGRA